MANLASVFIGCCTRRRVFIGCCEEGKKRVFGGSFVGAIPLTKLGFNIVLMKRLYEKPNTSLFHDMERKKVNGYTLLY